MLFEKAKAPSRQGHDLKMSTRSLLERERHVHERSTGQAPEAPQDSMFSLLLLSYLSSHVQLQELGTSFSSGAELQALKLTPFSSQL